MQEQEDSPSAAPVRATIRFLLQRLTDSRYEITRSTGPVSCKIVVKKLEYLLRELLPGSETFVELLNDAEARRYGTEDFFEKEIREARIRYERERRADIHWEFLHRIAAGPLITQVFRKFVELERGMRPAWLQQQMADFVPPISVHPGELGQTGERALLKALLLPPLARRFFAWSDLMRNHGADVDAIVDGLADRHREAFEAGMAAATEADRAAPSVAFIFDVFATTWKPLVEALNRNGMHTAWCGTVDRTVEDNYGACVTEKIPTRQKLITDFAGLLGFIAGARETELFLCAESFYSADWTAENAAVQCAMIHAVLATKSAADSGGALADDRPPSGNMNLIMYDGIKPLSRKLAEDFDAVHDVSVAGRFYQAMMRSASKVVFGSNTEEFAGFLRHAVPLRDTARTLYFPRYTSPPGREQPRLPLQDGRNIHMVCISVCLSDHPEPSRDGIERYIQAIIDQGIHFHYYCVEGSPGAARFGRSLSAAARERFHTHPIVTDQSALVGELHRYHIGLTPGDHTAFATGIAEIRCRFYRDATVKFMRSTVATSSIVYAGAGLPCVMAMGFPGGATLIGEDTVIQPSLSEYARLHRILMGWDLPRRIDIAERKRAEFYADRHIESFIGALSATTT